MSPSPKAETQINLREPLQKQQVTPVAHGVAMELAATGQKPKIRYQAPTTTEGALSTRAANLKNRIIFTQDETNIHEYIRRPLPHRTLSEYLTEQKPKKEEERGEEQ